MGRRPLRARAPTARYRGWLAAFYVAVLLLGGCRGETHAPRTAEGIFTAIEATSIIEWTSVTLREPYGKETRFLRGADVDLRYWRASHIREHISFSDRVMVTYQETPAGPVAQSLSHVGP